jgi:hypothetical protein
VSASAQSTPSAEAERFFRGLLQWAGVEPPVIVAGSPVEVRYTESGEEMLLYVFNHANEPALSDVSFRRPSGEYVATGMMSPRQIAIPRRANGMQMMHIELPPGGVQVYRISPVQR